MEHPSEIWSELAFTGLACGRSHVRRFHCRRMSPTSGSPTNPAKGYRIQHCAQPAEPMAQQLMILICDITSRMNLRSNHGLSSTTDLCLLHCGHTGKGVGGLCIAGVEPHHFFGR